MTLKDAIHTLGIRETKISGDIIKEAYRKAAKKFHPDINPAGEQMMKLINEAKHSLLSEILPIEWDSEKSTFQDYGHEINEALNKIIDIQGIAIEVCGAWVWVSGNTKEHWPKFKEAGFFYAPVKKQVYFRPKGFKSRSRGKTLSMDEIRNKYGSQGIKTKRPFQIRA